MGQLIPGGWTLEQSDHLAELVKSGRSYAECAPLLNEKFGTAYSRNSIIGRAHRIGITPPGKPKRPPYVRKPKQKTKPVVTFGNAKATRVYSSVQTTQPELRCVSVEPRNVTLLELNQSTQCHYIPGDDLLYCGHPSLEGKSYCGPHFALCREESRPRTDKRFSRAA